MNKHINVNISTRSHSHHQEANGVTNKLVFDEFDDDLRFEGEGTDHEHLRNQFDVLFNERNHAGSGDITLKENKSHNAISNL